MCKCRLFSGRPNLIERLIITTCSGDVSRQKFTLIRPEQPSDAAATRHDNSSRVYLRFSGLKARFRSVSTYRVHFSTARGLVMKGLVSTPFLWISALFFTHRLTSVTPDISLPCVPPKIATLLASLKRTLLL